MKRRKLKHSLVSKSSAIAFLIGVFVALVAVIVAPSSSISNLSGMALSTIPQRTCTDSDDGIETEQPGIVRFRLEGVVFQKFVDRCISGRPYKIEEGVCNYRSLIRTHEMLCPFSTTCFESEDVPASCVSCLDGRQNGLEEGVDCGGVCAKKCDALVPN